ncbi:MAG: HEAT repeat domain-containing protein [Phycisphaerae bacterium]|nr:HEAT repeat domain-containing protein [Phycisphaerae bacterium]
MNYKIRVNWRICKIFVVVLAILFTPQILFAADKDKPLNFDGAKWIWGGTQNTNPATHAAAQTLYFHKGFEFPAGSKPVSGEVIITCDNQWTLFVNGKNVGQSTSWQNPEKIDISKNLIIEQNAIAVEAVNTIAGPAGLIVKMMATFEDGKKFELISDASWICSDKKEAGWNETGFTPGQNWLSAIIAGEYGCAPWGNITSGNQGPGRRNTPYVPAVYKKETAFTDEIFANGVVFVRGHLPFNQHDANNYIQNIKGSRAYFEMDPPTPAAIGRQLISLIPFRPEGKLTVLCDAEGGVLGSPSVSYDGKTVYFSLAKKDEAYYHIYAVGIDGENLRQITTGPFHDYDPAELPDGRIIFSSTRIGNREEYHAKFASSLFTCNADGKNILPMTYHIVADREPHVTAGGSLTFIRSDNFLERAKVETHLHQTRMDGTGGQVIIGPGRSGIKYESNVGAEANSSWLRNYGVGSCAALPNGKVAAINQKGLVSSTSATGEPLIGGFVPYDMSPLPNGRLLCTSIKRKRLLTFDPATKDITEILATANLNMPAADPADLTRGYAEDDIHSVVHLAPRPAPMLRPSMVDPKADRSISKTGFLYCQNVLNTQHNTADLKRVKAVRIYEGRPFTLEPTKTIYAHIGTEGVELGTVPLASDGSFYVEVPADRPLAMQAVDGEGRPVVNEMSWIYVRPDEQRACVGCHAAASSAPVAMKLSKAIMNKPVKLLGQGEPHRFRANNGANGGVLNLQLERFREASSINLPASPEELLKAANNANANIRLSAIRRMGIGHDRDFVKALSDALHNEKNTEIRTAAALSLSACGNRKAVTALSKALKGSNATVRNAIRIALENLTGTASADSWKNPDWNAIESSQIEKLSSADSQEVLMALQSLGHIGGDASKKAIRQFLTANGDTDLRKLMTAMRSLGYLKDTESVELLTGLMNDNLTKKGGGGFHELGYGQKPIYISATAAEALGLIGTPQTEKALLAAFAKLNSFSDYVFRTAEHSWLMGCHSSILHYRMLEAFDRMGTRNTAPLVNRIVESIPADKDRGLLYELDSYEALSARIIARSGELENVVEACLAVLNGTNTKSDNSLIASVSLSPHAEGHIRRYSAQARAAQILSVVCDDTKYAPRIGELVKKYRAGNDSEKRNWCCFYLIRTLGRIGDKTSADILLDVLVNEPTEAPAGLNTPPTHILYKGWRPFFRPAAAWGLGMLKENKAVPALLNALENLDNAPCVRQQAAIALGRIGDKGCVEKLSDIAKDYPDVMTRRSILESIKSIKKP